MKLLLPAEYVAQATECVDKATSRVYLLSMVLADHTATHTLVDAIERAARRGVKVVVAADIFTFGEVTTGFLPFSYYSPGGKETASMVKILRKAGVKFHWLGRGRVTIVNGRTHSKWCIVDDTVFSFGGVNTYEGGIENVDYMFRITNERVADRLVDEQERIQSTDKSASNHPSISHEFVDFSVLLDGGFIGQSIIYRRACELAKEAIAITFVSQYCPTGKLARLLKKNNTTFYFNKPNQATALNKAVLTVSIALSGLKTSYERDTYLHAKCIIFMMPDGSKVAISGSHNFAYAGVILGTREVAIETNEPAIIAQLESFVKNHVA